MHSLCLEPHATLAMLIVGIDPDKPVALRAGAGVVAIAMWLSLPESWAGRDW